MSPHIISDGIFPDFTGPSEFERCIQWNSASLHWLIRPKYHNSCQGVLNWSPYIFLRELLFPVGTHTLCSDPITYLRIPAV